MANAHRGARREKARETRWRIMDAALAEFTEHGYHDTTMAAIAERAGVAVQTVYLGFRTKGGLLEEVVGNGSPAASPLMDAIAGFIASEDPGARVVPTMLPAYTDSRAFRDAFPECVAYGFFPQREMTLGEMWPLVHGKDERIAAADVGFAARAYKAIALELLG